MHLKYKIKTFILGLSALITTFSGTLQGQWTSPYYQIYQVSYDEPCHVYYGGELLYWTILQSNLDYAVDVDATDSADEILGPKRTHFLDFDWRCGVRGWIGWNSGCDWDTKLTYTYYKNRARGRETAKDDDTDLLASLLHPSTGKKIAEKATGRNDFEYQTIDLLLGRIQCFCEKSFVLHHFFGVRALRIKQDEQVTYKGGDFVLNSSAPHINNTNSTPARVKWDSKVEGIGIHAGMEMQYRMRCGLGLYGTFAGSVLGSKTRNRHLQVVLDNIKEVTSTEISLREKQSLLLPGYNLTTGIGWDWCCGCCLYGNFKLGYEFNQWFDIPQIRRYHFNNEGVSNSASSGKVGFHGATFRAELYF
ncbi:MAG: hypothetical protein K940chlam7_01122 [Chlamydiae bacterium]|nr:hypothetical protein [Chlamydiota bacterium]